jgi:hypothetical protein
MTKPVLLAALTLSLLAGCGRAVQPTSAARAILPPASNCGGTGSGGFHGGGGMPHVNAIGPVNPTPVKTSAPCPRR